MSEDYRVGTNVFSTVESAKKYYNCTDDHFSTMIHNKIIEIGVESLKNQYSTFVKKGQYGLDSDGRYFVTVTKRVENRLRFKQTPLSTKILDQVLTNRREILRRTFVKKVYHQDLFRIEKSLGYSKSKNTMVSDPYVTYFVSKFESNGQVRKVYYFVQSSIYYFFY